MNGEEFQKTRSGNWVCSMAATQEVEKVNIKLRLYGSLQRFGKTEGWFEQEITAFTSIGDLLVALNLPAGNVSFVTVNGRKQNLGYVLKGGEEVRVFPPVTGG